MDESTYRQVLGQFLNDYWGTFHEVVEAQSVNPHMLAGALFDELVAAHERFVAVRGGADEALGRLGHEWFHVADRRKDTLDAPFTARKSLTREQFGIIYDELMAMGKRFRGRLPGRRRSRPGTARPDGRFGRTRSADSDAPRFDSTRSIHAERLDGRDARAPQRRRQ
jgi:hypothetical protein